MSKKLVCVLGTHKFGEWEYISPQKCEQKRICEWNELHTQEHIKHAWGDWQTGDPNPNCPWCKGAGKYWQEPEPNLDRDIQTMIRNQAIGNHANVINTVSVTGAGNVNLLHREGIRANAKEFIRLMTDLYK